MCCFFHSLQPVSFFLLLLPFFPLAIYRSLGACLTFFICMHTARVCECFFTTQCNITIPKRCVCESLWCVVYGVCAVFFLSPVTFFLLHSRFFVDDDDDSIVDVHKSSFIFSLYVRTHRLFTRFCC